MLKMVEEYEEALDQLYERDGRLNQRARQQLEAMIASLSVLFDE
jgi:hypothetical protein